MEGTEKEFSWNDVNQNKLTGETGIVTSVHKTGFSVRVGNSAHFCIINNSFKGGHKPIVNDIVELEKSVDQYVITGVLERKNYIARYDFYKNNSQGFAANVDTLFVVTSANHEFSINRIMRFLAIAGAQDVRKVIVLTKIDLAHDIAPYQKKLQTHLGEFESVLVNGTLKNDAARLLAFIPKDGTALLTGSSGVGKTTIVNSLCDLSLRTSTVQDEQHGNKGKHTTSARTVYFLEDGRRIIDMPGVRIVGVEKQTADNSPVFARITAFAKQCKYTNCNHQTEDNCAVLAAVANGGITADELERYREIVDNAQRVPRRRKV